MAAQPIIQIVIAYAWGRNHLPDPGLSKDKRWRALRSFAIKAHQEALRRCARRLRQMELASPTYLEDQADGVCGKQKRLRKLPIRTGVSISSAYVPVTRRLRAGAGRFIWEDILQRIIMADILIFDLTPRSGEKMPASNVLLELGAAMAMCPPKPVFPVVDNINRIKQLMPSDLDGLIVGVIASDRIVQDRALYSAIAEKIAESVEARGFCARAQS
jgi:hypothetical protein